MNSSQLQNGFLRSGSLICASLINLDIDFKVDAHYSDVIMIAMASQITGVSMVYSIVCSGADQRRHQSSASLVFVRGIHRWSVDSPHKGPVTRKMFPFDDVIMHFKSPTRSGGHIAVRASYRCDIMHTAKCIALIIHYESPLGLVVEVQALVRDNISP